MLPCCRSRRSWLSACALARHASQRVRSGAAGRCWQRRQMPDATSSAATCSAACCRLARQFGHRYVLPSNAWRQSVHSPSAWSCRLSAWWRFCFRSRNPGLRSHGRWRLQQFAHTSAGRSLPLRGLRPSGPLHSRQSVGRSEWLSPWPVMSPTPGPHCRRGGERKGSTHRPTVPDPGLWKCLATVPTPLPSHPSMLSVPAAHQDTPRACRCPRGAMSNATLGLQAARRLPSSVSIEGCCTKLPWRSPSFQS